MVLSGLPGESLGQGAALSTSASGDFRQFADKSGRKMEARVLSVTPDRKKMKIQLRDGKETELEIVLLSLDDQQYLKEWIATQPAALKPSYRLEVAVEKINPQPVDRRSGGGYRLSTEHVAYQIKLTNLGRDSLPGAVIESYVIRKEGMSIYKDSGSGDWTYLTDFDSRTQLTRDVATLDSLEFNREQVVKTSTVQLDGFLDDKFLGIPTDELVGMIVQVRDQFGNIAGVWRSSEPAVAKIEWDTVVSQASTEPPPPAP